MRRRNGKAAPSEAERIEHLNRVLKAIRNVNQLITRVRDRESLLKGACDCLTETRGYLNAWIALLDGDGQFDIAYETGLGENFLSVVALLRQGRRIRCVERAMAEDGVVITRNLPSECPGCPIAKASPERGVLTTRLVFEDHNFGLLSVAIPREMLDDEEESELFAEVAGDISFALHALRQKDEKTELNRALARAASNLKSITAAMHESVSVIADNGDFLYANRTAIRNLSDDENNTLVGRNIREFVPPEQAAALLERYGRVLASGETSINEVAVSLRGEERWFHNTLQPIDYGPGDVRALLSVSLDITERKRMETALLENIATREKAERRLEALLNISALAHADFKTICDHTLDALVRMTASRFGFYGFIEDGETAMTIHSWSGEAMAGCRMSDKPTRFSIADAGVWAEAVRLRQPLVLNDYVAAHPAKKGLPVGHVPLKNLLVVPFIYEGRIIAVAAVANREGDYGQDDIEQVTAFLSGIQTIVAQQQAKAELRESEERYRTMVENLDAVIMRFDREHRHTFVCERAETYSGLPPEKMLGKTHYELGFPPELCAYWEKAIDQVFRTGTPVNDEFEFDAPNGHVIFDWRLLPEFDKHGQIATVLSIARDITGSIRTELEYGYLFKHMIEGFAVHDIVLDADGVPVDYRFLDVNPAFEKLTGLTREKIIGKTVLEILPGTEREWIDRYGKVALTREPTFFENYSAELDRHFKVSAYSPAPGQFATIFEDITEHRRMEEQLRQSEKMQAIGQLAGGVAHDFNNQLQGIMGNCEMLVMRLTDDELRRYADNILAASRRAADLNKQLLAFARKGHYLSVPIDVHDVINEVIAILEHSIDKRIRLTRHFEAAPSVIAGDPTQIQNMLLNLALNSRDAMPEGGELSFTTRTRRLDREYFREKGSDCAPGHYVWISVTDTGTGITGEVQKRMFEPFFTTKPVGKGTGMGLSAVFGTVKNHSGDLRVYSEVGHGTTFNIYLPLPTNADGARVAEATVPRITRSLRVLLIDDEEHVREIASDMLQTMGHAVEVRNDGRAGLEYFRDHWREIDLVILDMVMPRMNGRDAYLEMKKIDPRLTVLLATGFSLNGYAQELLDEGVAGFLQKPFSFESLADAIAEIVEKK